MRKVWNCPVAMDDGYEAGMPRDAEVLNGQLQRGEPPVWALVGPEAAKERRRFRLAGAGRPIPGGVRHVGTFQTAGVSLVFHLSQHPAKPETAR